MNNESGVSSIASLRNAIDSSAQTFKALVGENRNANYPQFSDHYFTGEYPIKRVDQNENKIVSQLSFLSGKSSN